MSRIARCGACVQQRQEVLTVALIRFIRRKKRISARAMLHAGLIELFSNIYRLDG